MDRRFRNSLQLLLLTFFSFSLVFISWSRRTDELFLQDELRPKLIIERRISRSLDSVISDDVDLSLSPNVVPATTVRSRIRKLQNLLELDDIYIGVKTSAKFHRTRLGIVLDTWASVARRQTYFFSDTDDDEIQKRTGGHVINTGCLSGHSRQDLCCKMGVELDYFLQSGKQWFCHVDDDVYVNVRRLVKLLRRYDVTKDWYLGKPSLAKPVIMRDTSTDGRAPESFWFATGGAGFCVSRSLALKMAPLASGARLRNVCDRIKLPDDCSVGYVINHLLRVELRVVKDFHSHLEPLNLVTDDNLHKHLTLSYSSDFGGTHELNVADVSGFSLEQDPTRFRSVHCHLYSYLDECKNMKR